MDLTQEKRPVTSYSDKCKNYGFHKKHLGDYRLLQVESTVWNELVLSACFIHTFPEQSANYF